MKRRVLRRPRRDPRADAAHTLRVGLAALALLVLALAVV